MSKYAISSLRKLDNGLVSFLMEQGIDLPKSSNILRSRRKAKKMLREISSVLENKKPSEILALFKKYNLKKAEKDIENAKKLQGDFLERRAENADKFFKKMEENGFTTPDYGHIPEAFKPKDDISFKIPITKAVINLFKVGNIKKIINGLKKLNFGLPSSGGNIMRNKKTQRKAQEEAIKKLMQEYYRDQITNPFLKKLLSRKNNKDFPLYAKPTLQTIIQGQDATLDFIIKMDNALNEGDKAACVKYAGKLGLGIGNLEEALNESASKQSVVEDDEKIKKDVLSI